jgi:hypothetical protein
VNRVVHHHAWVRLEGGQVVRAYAWGGQTVWNQGRPTLAEKDLGMRCREYGETEAPVEYGQLNPAAYNAERVPSLAARWSVDPMTIDPRHFSANSGIAGESRPF